MRQLKRMAYVSVIMPCFNHGRFLRESIAGVLNQSWQPEELVVVDDGSTDDSRAVMLDVAHRDDRVKLVLRESNRGPSRSRNDALRIAVGDYVAFCDADDVWLPQKLEVQVEALRQRPDCAATYCDSLMVDEAGVSQGRRFSDEFPPPARPTGRLFAELCTRNFINMPTVLLRRDCLGQTAWFDEHTRVLEDWWWWIQLSRRHQFVYVDQPLVKYRVHNRSTSLTQRRDYHLNRCKVARRVLDQYRDLPAPIRARIWYQMGIDLGCLGKERMARKCLWMALTAEATRGRGGPLFLKAAARWALLAIPRTN